MLQNDLRRFFAYIFMPTWNFQVGTIVFRTKKNGTILSLFSNESNEEEIRKIKKKSFE